MVFYFSGTGNSAWAARQLARLTGDEAYDITNLKEPPNVAKAKQIGFVFPVYAWGAPEIMVNFARKVPKTDAFSFGACTCGVDAGLTMKQFAKFYPLSSIYSLLMPNNYIIGSDTDTQSGILQKNHCRPEGIGTDGPRDSATDSSIPSTRRDTGWSEVPSCQLWV